MNYAFILTSAYVLLVLIVIIQLYAKTKVKQRINDLLEWKPEEEIIKKLGLFGLGVFLIIIGHEWSRFDGLTGAFIKLLGFFSFYALIRDLSPSINGISFPNAYKIVIAIIGFFAVIVIMTGLVQMSWAENSAEYVGAIFDGITGLIDTFLTNLEPIKDFLQWWFEFSAPVAMGGGL